MVVAEERQDELVILDRIREMVRLASGVDDNEVLSMEVAQIALDCLERFGQRLRELHSTNVAAVGTNTLRRIKNSEEFLAQAEQRLGHPIEIISGIEEARLIYQGVAHSLEPDHKDKLVIDIGGGSTELIIGEDFTPKLMESLEMGCVTMTKRFFSDGEIKKKRIEAARISVLQKMKAVRHSFRHQGWDVVIGSSGTIRSAFSVIHELGLADREGITFNALNKLLKKLSKYKTLDEIQIAGLSERRVPVFLGGVIVLAGVFEALDIDQMQVSDGAVREGLLYDMLGRRHNQDIRNTSIKRLGQRFHVDELHAERIERTASEFLQQVFADWSMSYPAAQTLLSWACEVHEIGRDISHSSYHKHSAYIVENADLAGFSRQEQARVATVVRWHRGKLVEDFNQSLNRSCQLPVMRLTLLLRLAVIFHRSRIDTRLPAISLAVNDDNIQVNIPAEWLEQHPLTLNDLEQEAEYLKAIDIQLRVSS